MRATFYRICDIRPRRRTTHFFTFSVMSDARDVLDVVTPVWNEEIISFLAAWLSSFSKKKIGANKDGRRKRLITSEFVVLYVRSSFEMPTLNRVIDSCVAHRQLEQLLRRLRDGWTLPRLQRPSLATSAAYRKLNLIYVFLTADKLFFYLFAKHGLLRFTLDRCNLVSDIVRSLIFKNLPSNFYFHGG